MYYYSDNKHILYFRVHIYKSFSVPILTDAKKRLRQSWAMLSSEQWQNQRSLQCFLQRYWSVSKSGRNKHSTVCIRKEGRQKYKKQPSYQAHTARALHQEKKKKEGGRKRS